ncbi:hypothetical protein NDK47_05835 [Brevibacillus ruminantium]|uniref:D-isomer specific 2-hydroxyacid dehydrogenase catalytic domain-containing protein n=1 Tax=Brevibacillus ruminantium TaxID=2950604 RepID=A0ABY4WIW7_9BACL|nr:hypothetical protein [Brevibacillus ruminantium]USG66819.1 hypothetical protein NDK47_05835 [Brevibacillus ruminantium]
MTTKPLVYATRQLASELIEYRKETATVEVWEEDCACPPEVLLEEQADGLLMMMADRVDEELPSRARHQKVVASMAARYENIDTAAARKRGVLVTNTPDVQMEATADPAFALLLAAARRISEANRYVMVGGWTGWKPVLMAGQTRLGMGKLAAANIRSALEGKGLVTPV